MNLELRQSFHPKLKIKKYRDAFVSSRISQTIALQAKVLRQTKGLSQAELARDLNTSQNAISRLERPDYGRPSISTLKKYASYFDIGIVVRFVPFSKLIDIVADPDADILVSAFANDDGFIHAEPVAAKDENAIASKKHPQSETADHKPDLNAVAAGNAVKDDTKDRAKLYELARKTDNNSFRDSGIDNAQQQGA